jgi:formamidopyrimidine-DNA glycosylase
MPELPEAETLKRQLMQVVLGEEILKTCVLDEKLNPFYLEGRTVVSISRRGKGIYMGLDDGTSVSLRLRMTGRLLWQKEGALRLPHTRFTADFRRGRLDLIDPRRFATLTLEKTGDNIPGEAMHPLENFSARSISEIAGKRKLPVKAFLMDQRFIAGIGNIYACEILYAASISPLRQAFALSFREWRLIADAAVAILNKAVECRGTTVSDGRDLFGQRGEYQNYLKVYGRKGTLCPRCGSIIERLKLSGRGTYFCPACQR